MQLQVTLDTPRLDQCIEMLEQVHAYVDVAEVGNPLIIDVGLSLVEGLRAEFPQMGICADAKIVNSGHYIASHCFDRGATMVTVMGLAPDQTIEGAVASAELFGGSPASPTSPHVRVSSRSSVSRTSAPTPDTRTVSSQAIPSRTHVRASPRPSPRYLATTTRSANSTSSVRARMAGRCRPSWAASARTTSTRSSTTGRSLSSLVVPSWVPSRRRTPQPISESTSRVRADEKNATKLAADRGRRERPPCEPSAV